MTARHLTASMVVVDPAAESVLLVHHLASGLWQFSGGHVDAGETPAEAALQEVLEETGIRATVHGQPLDLPGMEWHPSPWVTAEIPASAKPERPGKPAEAAHVHIDLLFIGTANSSDLLTPAVAEVGSVRWVNVDNLASVNVRAEVPRLTHLALAEVLVSTAMEASRARY